MSIRLLLGFAVLLSLSLVNTAPANALGLKIAPLEYKTTLKKDEKKQGFIDVSNPSGQTVTVVTSVQAFKQINDDGGLQFFDDKQVATGITTDLQSFELGPRQAVRMFFTVNGGLLPHGDDYAAIFFTTQPKTPTNGVGQLVRVGTLLSIVNQTPGTRSATITGLNVPFLQLSDTIDGSYSVKNTGKSNSGFYPDVSISAAPGGPKRSVESSLLFGGRERSNQFTYAAGIGIHLVKVSYQGSEQSRFVITLMPWMIVVFALVILVVATELILLKRRRSQTRQKTPSTPEK